MTKRKGERMLDILKENYQDSETDLALYVGAHKYEDAPGMQQVLWYVKGTPDQLGEIITYNMKKSMRFRESVVSGLSKYLIAKHGREQLMDVLRVLELYKDASDDANNTNEA